MGFPDVDWKAYLAGAPAGCAELAGLEELIVRLEALSAC